MKRILSICSGIICLWTAMSFAQEQPTLTVHEWGTITTMHYSDGRVSGYLNKIRPEEVLPDFVHRMDTDFLKSFGKTPEGGGHPSVTMRLETPVIYFYPSSGFDLAQPIDVQVEFYGGLINEFYPSGEVSHENVVTDEWDQPDINQTTLGKLSWKGIRLDTDGVGPATDSHVWLSPRQVDATAVKSVDGEREKYLFYRGVAHLNALFRTKHNIEQKTIDVYNPAEEDFSWGASLPHLWVIQVEDDGKLAFREMGPVIFSQDPQQIIASASVDFKPEEYASENLDRLRESMQAALVERGLFPKEAQAMLETWKAAYFQQKGVRIFYLVPQEWIDRHLPLKFSVPVDLKRVLIGRIDLAF